MILADKRGNLFNVEAVLAAEKDPEELRMLAQGLLEYIQTPVWTKTSDLSPSGGEDLYWVESVLGRVNVCYFNGGTGMWVDLSGGEEYLLRGTSYIKIEQPK